MCKYLAVGGHLFLSGLTSAKVLASIFSVTKCVEEHKMQGNFMLRELKSNGTILVSRFKCMLSQVFFP